MRVETGNLLQRPRHSNDMTNTIDRLSISRWPRSELMACAAAIVGLILSTTKAQDLTHPSHLVPEEWMTVAEKTDFLATGTYADVVTYCKRMAEVAPWVHYTTCGTSPQGRDIPLVIASKDKAFTPQAAKATGKLIVFINNGIHSGEIEGKDATSMLMRDIAITGQHGKLLDNVILVVMPIFSVDAHERSGPYNRINQNGPIEMGWRVNSQYLNLNRDFIKAEAPEMHAWLRVWNEWDPDLHFDNHTSDGGDWQYDLTFDTATHADASPSIADWVKNSLYPHLFPALEADGHTPFIYFGFVDSLDPTKGIRSGAFSPRFSTGYAAIRNRPSILVETHMLKDYRTRVIGTYHVMLHTLELLNRNPRALREAIRNSEEDTLAMGTTYDPDVQIPMRFKGSDASRTINFKGVAYQRRLSEISGGLIIDYDASKLIEFEIPYFDDVEVEKAVAPPLGYLIPRQWTEVIDRLHLHGIEAVRLSKPITGTFESYRFEDVSFAVKPFEGHHLVSYTAVPITVERTFPAGSVYVPLKQRGAKVIMHMLEPDAPDSLMAWGFLNRILERKEYAEPYVMEPLAREMLDQDPDLKAEFEDKLKSDPAFAGNPAQRLDFFYRHSPWWDPQLNVYPIVRVIQPITVEGESIG